MVAHATNPYIPLEEFLKRERAAETKSEYWDGVIVAMSGGTPEHAIITHNLNVELGVQLLGRVCGAFSPDLGVYTAECNHYFYPDMAVVGGEPAYKDVQGTRCLINPRLIVEVLSASTESADTGFKFDCYGTLESLQTYLLVSQDRARVAVHERRPNGAWELRVYHGLEAVVALPSIDCQLRLAALYARIEFPPKPSLLNEVATTE